MFFFNSFLYNTSAYLICFVLLITIFIFYVGGTRLGEFQQKNHPDAKADGVGVLEGSLMGLLALLLSFTFSMSASRFDDRRAKIVDEANDIGTAVLQADMYPDTTRDAFRKDFELYVEERIAYFNTGNDETEISNSLKRSGAIAARIWQRATSLSKPAVITLPHSVMIPSLNKMIDAATTTDAARLERVPDSIIWLLIILTMLESMIIGYARKEKKNDWVILILYSLMTVITIFTIMDLDRPRRGIIKTNDANQKIIELRTMFQKQ